MRKLMLLSILVLAASWAAAQNYPSQKGSASAGSTTVQGCLSSSGDNYVLTDKNGTTYRLTGETAKLKEHVGHEMKVTGTSESSGQTDNSTSSTIEVASFKHVSKTCQNTGGGMQH